MALNRTVRWAPWTGLGLEHLVIDETDRGISADAVVVGETNGLRFGLQYRLFLDRNWNCIHLLVSNTGMIVSAGEEPRLSASFRRRNGRWEHMEFQREMPALDDCIDLDLSFTPFTNTLPIRRLGLEIGQSGAIKVAHLQPPDFVPRPAEQRYTRLAQWRYLYEDVTFDFSAELEVDEDGLVLDYPGLFRRVPD